MKWFRRNEQIGECEMQPTRDNEATRAKERALLAQREASQDLQEFSERAARSRSDRARNHFSQVIFDAMRKAP